MNKTFSVIRREFLARVATRSFVISTLLVPVFMVLIGMHTRDRVDRATDALTRLADHLVLRVVHRPVEDARNPSLKTRWLMEHPNSKKALKDEGMVVPMAIFFSASAKFSACMSVFMAMNSTLASPFSTMRFTAFEPPPPTPITLITACPLCLVTGIRG